MTYRARCASLHLVSAWVRRRSSLRLQTEYRSSCIAGPLIGRWNFFLERNFPLRSIGSGSTGKVSLRALARRVGADQLIM